MQLPIIFVIWNKNIRTLIKETLDDRRDPFYLASTSTEGEDLIQRHGEKIKTLVCTTVLPGNLENGGHDLAKIVKSYHGKIKTIALISENEEEKHIKNFDAYYKKYATRDDMKRVIADAKESLRYHGKPQYK